MSDTEQEKQLDEEDEDSEHKSQRQQRRAVTRALSTSNSVNNNNNNSNNNNNKNSTNNGNNPARKKRGPGRPPTKHLQQQQKAQEQQNQDDAKRKRRGPGRPPKRKKKSSVASDNESNATGQSTSNKKARTQEDDHSGNDNANKNHDDDQENQEDDDNEDEYDDARESTRGGYETDPETSLDNKSKVSTIHWDPAETAKIGWRIRIPGLERDGRIVRYDPYTHKHKIQFLETNMNLLTPADNNATNTNTGKKKPGRKSNKNQSNNYIWLRLRCTSMELATRLVWAHVKGYAWWPALVMESNDNDMRPKDGYVLVSFIGSPEIANLRDTVDCVRPFTKKLTDPIIIKSKKKRNAKCIAMAHEERVTIEKAQNQASLLYAKKGFYISNHITATNYIGKRVQIFRNDVNYPWGDTVIGTVRKYSTFQKKWLLTFEVSYKTRKKYGPAWINIEAKECSLQIMDCADKRKKNSILEPTNMHLIPFLYGYKISTDDDSIDDDNNSPDVKETKCTIAEEGSTKEIEKLLTDCCRGCVDIFRDSESYHSTKHAQNQNKLTCSDCDASYHITCHDPPISIESYQKIIKDGVPWKCSKCVLCKGCYQKDIVFGSHPYPLPPTVSPFRNNGESLDLCSMCSKAYEDERYCPNCAHTWNDVKYQKVIKQLEKEERKQKHCTSDNVVLLPTASASTNYSLFSTTKEIMKQFKGMVNIDPAVYYAESYMWGYTEGDMMVCDSCNIWVHAGCANVTEDEYTATSQGEHPMYSKEFLCRMCCRHRCKEIIQALEKEDTMMLFALPVSEQVAPNYHDVIKEPMDLQTMMIRVENEEYDNYAWVRESFELMVLNALTFNRYFTLCWNEAKRFYEASMENVFKILGKAAPPSDRYYQGIQKNFVAAEKAKKMEEQRIQQDESAEKKDLVAGSEVTSVVALPKLRESPPDEASCLPFTEVRLKPVDAFYFSWMDCCFTCGSAGAADTMMFCVDCGEAFHSFCANVPIHSMEISSVAGWRCPNCKICEISGDAPKDELKMLFCEMCDRAFSLDLLDPPLSSAPSGLWICGQCVDCKVCGNTSEPNGVSLKYWSRDPEKCYRCGGCKGIAKQDKSMKCTVCTKMLRKSDTDYLSCSASGCDSKVHIFCDQRAGEHFRARKKAHKAKNSGFLCRSCFEKTDSTKNTAITQGGGSSNVNRAAKIAQSKMINQFLRKYLHEQAWVTVSQGTYGPDSPYSPHELHKKLIDEIEWEIRSMCKEEYITIIQEGIRIYTKAKNSFGDPRVITQRAEEGKLDHDIPLWMRQRACRFITLTNISKWDVDGYSGNQIKNCVLHAKLAAAFLEVSCRVMEIAAKKYVKCYARVTSLLKGPHTSCGQYELPIESIKSKKYKGIISEKEILSSLGHCLSLDAIECAENIRASSDAKKVEQSAKNDTDKMSEMYKIASPMCGWDQYVASDMMNNDRAWYDPRKCCLCHLCGDDDAGFEADEEGQENNAPLGSEFEIARLGRLLPMSDGLWVHASCATWSSEVWEAPRGGLIHAVEKARSRGAQLKCFGCGRSGATVGCNKNNCSLNYHFPCAKACGAVFTTNRQVFCSNHKVGITDVLEKESFEAMKTLIVAPEKQKANFEKDIVESDEENMVCPRVGSFVLHSLGTIEQKYDGYHSEDYIYPKDYLATRIFWSTQSPRTRTVYILRIEQAPNGEDGAVFSITPGDEPTSIIRSSTINGAYSTLMARVKKVNSECFSNGNLFSKLPTVRRTRKKMFSLNGPQFFGIGLNMIRKMIETLPGVEAVVAPLTATSPKYRFCFVQPTIESIVDLQRKRVAVAAERALENTSGCARTEGRVAVARSGGSGRITRALVRSAEEDVLPNSADPSKRTDAEKSDKRMNQVKYQRYKSIPMEQRLVARRSHIHGWGLFSKVDINKDDIIVEYMGETIRQCIADKREKQYEISGEGSCYMFRLDLQRIVDATVIGCMARFMNHSCQPNAYAKVITVDTEELKGQEKKIVVFANKDIAAGDEITYDYKFPVEDGSLRCTCGAPNCIGRMN